MSRVACISPGRVIAATISAAVVAGGLTLGAGTAAAASPAKGSYVVLLKSGATTEQVAAEARKVGAAPSHTYSHAVAGYSANLTSVQLSEVKSDPSVLMVAGDSSLTLSGKRGHGPKWQTKSAIGNNHQPAGQTITSYTQFIPTSLERVGLQNSRTANVNKHGPGVNASIAVIDSGISPSPDLNVVGAVNCSDDPSSDLKDGISHGTEVASVAAAQDNGFGVVGTAPGARIYNVKVFDDAGNADISNAICGMDWVVAHHAEIDVANMSFEDDTYSNDNDCGLKNGDAFHYAICRAKADGITLVAGSGNDGVSADSLIPQGYPEVITVSGYQDTDGIPGGKGSACGDGFGDADDMWAAWSNFGTSVDLMAVADCNQVIANDDTMEWDSGTSFAGPAVAGAAADLAATHCSWSPQAIENYLKRTATYAHLGSNPHHFGLLNMSAI
jgi:subtilisin